MFKCQFCKYQAVGETWYEQTHHFDKCNLTIYMIRIKGKKQDFPYRVAALKLKCTVNEHLKGR